MFTDLEYTSLVEEYLDSIFRIALNYTKEAADAQDIAQEVFLKLYRENRYFESREHCKHWLIRVAINECKKWSRSPWRRHVSLDASIAAMPKQQEQKDLLRRFDDSIDDGNFENKKGFFQKLKDLFD